METVSTYEVYRREGYPMVKSNEIGGRSLFRIDPDGKCDPAKILRTMRQSVVPRSQKTPRENVTRFSPPCHRLNRVYKSFRYALVSGQREEKPNERKRMKKRRRNCQRTETKDTFFSIVEQRGEYNTCIVEVQ